MFSYLVWVIYLCSAHFPSLWLFALLFKVHYSAKLSCLFGSFLLLWVAICYPFISISILLEKKITHNFGTNICKVYIQLRANNQNMCEIQLNNKKTIQKKRQNIWTDTSLKERSGWLAHEKASQHSWSLVESQWKCIFSVRMTIFKNSIGSRYWQRWELGSTAGGNENLYHCAVKSSGDSWKTKRKVALIQQFMDRNCNRCFQSRSGSPCSSQRYSQWLRL